MGLPIWREPEDEEVFKAKVKNTPVADIPSLDRVRSARIRRRPSVHGLRGRAQADARNNQRSRVPRLERSLPLSRYPSTMPRSMRDGIPPISTLLEVANRPPGRMSTASRDAIPDDTIARPVVTSEHAPQDIVPPGERLGVRARLLASTNRILETLGNTGRRPGSTERERSNNDNNNGTHSITETTWGPPLTESPQPIHVRLPAHEYGRQARGDSHTLRSLQGEMLAGELERGWWQSRDQHRVRSPTPVDEWETMRSTIAPDTTLPSADSSFLSAAVNQSFNRGSSTATTTENGTQSTSISSASNTGGQDADSVSSVDSEEVCSEDDRFVQRSESLAYNMYYKEMESPEGRVRIAEQEMIRQREGNRFALSAETAAVDIGLRLIEAAVDRVEVLRTSGTSSATDWTDNPDLLRLAEITAHENERSQHVAGATENDPLSDTSMLNEGDQSRDMADSLLAGLDSGEQNLGAMRRIVERLASRDDVPEEWWISMGLNLSRTRTRRLRPAATDESPVRSSLSRTRTGRIERMRPREVLHDDRGSRL